MVIVAPTYFTPRLLQPQKIFFHEEDLRHGIKSLRNSVMEKSNLRLNPFRSPDKKHYALSQQIPLSSYD
ncbi:hypothetical protein PAAG_11328 [Paracoccidioides lutzii Pb01]|uniref:Uncharacterized protein n=1 Tax=Paracoccidioides lutzii (strain ATCC MYA-826 / Pb01) TaxID=502779 RepID=A0A0A2V6F4_PARBA|nr:hypothetical protein PAAG_11328 [Paracoccidioides lutzii Pb01]KGQ01937.1 hypothetical protein PAAG_11328 [Paracoccidioides lutzii Pb01]